MPALRTNRSRRSLTFTSVLLLSTALAAPAFAQIEEVVVTAQKRAEDVQTVPIAITAFTSQDLSTKQIKSFDDLQYNVPNVTYARSNFGAGADFQIRGIGVTAIGYDAEAGVAIVVDNVFLDLPPLANADFYDLSDVEVLAGPQSTLYGRGAVGGVVSVTTARPDLDAGSASIMASYGNYNAKEVEGDVDMPLVTDELGIRLSGDWIDHSGYVSNIFNNSHADSENEYSFRGSLRWEPSSNTTVDLVGSLSNENDNAMRSQKQLCTTDIDGNAGLFAQFGRNGAGQRKFDAGDDRVVAAGLRERFCWRPARRARAVPRTLQPVGRPVSPARSVDPRARARSIPTSPRPIRRMTNSCPPSGNRRTSFPGSMPT